METNFQGSALDILKITYREILRKFQARQEDIDRLWQDNAHRIVKFAKICEMFENIIMIKIDTCPKIGGPNHTVKYTRGLNN